MSEINDDKKSCSNCECAITGSDYLNHGSGYLCSECGAICSGCDNVSVRDDLFYADGELLCDSCSFACGRCGDYSYTCNSHYVEGDDWCERCYENYSFYCESCEESYSSYGTDSHWLERSGMTYCEGCFDSFAYYCGDCDMNFLSDYPCDCNGNGTRTCRCRNGVIHDYNCKPAVEFKGTSKHGVFMGFELETEYKRGDASTEAAKFASAQLQGIAMLKHDGSLHNGFEVVTQPHSHSEYRDNSALLWDTIDQLRTTHGARSWDTETCGLHIHVSRAGFSGGAHTHRFMALIYKNAPEMMKFAGRKSRFARFNDVYSFDQYDRPVFSLKHKLGSAGFNSERYSAINTNNRETLELRFFRGTMNPSGVLAALDLVQASVEYTRHLTLSDVKAGALSWTWFYDYVEQNNGLYPDLYLRMAKVASVDITNRQEIGA